MHTADTQVHYALQYLASAAKNFLSAQDDDSHTNVVWDEPSRSFIGRTLPNGDHLSIRMDEFRLAWSAEQDYSISLANRSHGEVLVWLHHMAVKMGYDEFEFEIAYQLGQGWGHPMRMYEPLDESRLEIMIANRNTAQHFCQQVLDTLTEQAEVRVWPHHFDTGVYLIHDSSKLGIGFGMAIPDSVVDDYYFYIGANKDGKSIEPVDFPKLTHGRWSSEDYKGAVFAIKSSDEKSRAEFIKEALDRLLTQAD